MDRNSIEWRVKLFRDALSFQKPEKVPNISNCFTWKILDSQYSQKQALYNWKVMEKVVVGYHERYRFDAYADFGTRDALAFTDALGGGLHIFDEKSNAVYAKDIEGVFDSDDYVAYAKDPVGIGRKMFARKYPDMDSEKLYKGMREMMNYSQYTTKITKIMNEKYQVPTVGTGSLLPFELLFWLKGIKGMGVDLRRKNQEIAEACSIMWENGSRQGFEAIFDADGSKKIDDMHTAMLAHSILSREQFEKLYLPHMLEIIGMAKDTGKICSFYAESEIDRFADMFADTPKGHFALWPEKGDLFALRRILPNVALIGGVDSDVLGQGTEEECINHVKALIDGLGEGYVVGHRLMLSYKYDCKRENQIALNRFVDSYRI
ncbi:MAG: hypothetical protein IJI56_06665 [Firmicutes bacterium]|nr:hypothetical protein [Bacillota bacterium]